MLRVGVIGAGLMGTLHATSWTKTPACLAAVYSNVPEKTRLVAHDCDTQAADSVEALIDSVDIVDVCTPTYLHADMVLKAAAAGKHIVCEKPLARTLEQAEQMIAACREAGVKLLVAHVVRFFPEYAQAKAIVDRGEIGRVGVVRLRRTSSLPAWSEENWLMDEAKSGGMILDLMVHDFDYARWVAGEVESVYARNVRRDRPDERRDYALAILRHKNGALSHIEGGWAYPAGMFRTALEIAGSGGLIEHPSDSSVPIQIHMMETGTAKSVDVPSSPLIEDPYLTEIKHFYDVIANDTAPRVTVDDGLAALRIGLAAIESARAGRRVTL
jgi:myo-inositol 2-dehydrogenase/D-chiro-inositol 1-dehydrogenase